MSNAPGTTLIDTHAHLAAFDAALDALTRYAATTWLGAPVPTCPGWDVLDLLAHQGMVHRWAGAALRGDRESMGNAALLETEGRTSADPLAWVRHGAEGLAASLREAPDDLDALVFLPNAPAARAFWARRQAHELTIHAVDALAAALGRAPAADDVWFGADLAADGIDELLVGFWSRRGGRLRSSSPYAVYVRPLDAPVSWLVEVGDGPVRIARVAAGASGGIPADTELTGTAVDLYLALWNRGGSVRDAGGIIDRWREAGKVEWA